MLSIAGSPRHESTESCRGDSKKGLRGLLLRVRTGLGAAKLSQGAGRRATLVCVGGVVHRVRPLNSRSATTPPLIGVFPRRERESQVANLISPSALQSSTKAYKLENSAKHGDGTLFLCYGR